MKQLIICITVILLLGTSSSWGQNKILHSPDGQLKVNVLVKNGRPHYNITYQDKLMLEDSPLGLETNIGDFSKDMTYMGIKESKIDKTYTQDRIKSSRIHYQANEFIFTFQNKEKQSIDIIFQVGDNDLAFCYSIPQYGEISNCMVKREVSGFDFPSYTTTFITPQSESMIGWKGTKPSYEEEYVPDEPIGTPSQYGQGYTFPALFRVGSNGWILLSETGVNSLYCGSHLSEGTIDGLYSISYPNPTENDGYGTANPYLALPGKTPWRTITVGNNLKPIVETTIPFSVVEPQYEPSKQYTFGRSTWSWIMWQDSSINFDDQLKYIDLSAALGYEFVLVDNWWDSHIGRGKIEELAHYAKTKNVSLCLWYNSNGYWNDAPQGPKNRINTSISRKKEMAWMKSIGVKGIKVDFFGGDKQETMKLYEDILSDANDYGLAVIFHGCTLPRGWERMYPNYIGSEAVLASENLIFSQKACDMEAYNATLHPFIRNTVGSMEFGPVLLNKRLNRENNGGNIRKTTDIFQLATAVLFQSSIQAFALAPNNLYDVPEFEIDFMKKVPTIWDETRFIDGYPGKYCILARRHGSSWYIAGINAQDETLRIDVQLPMLREKTVKMYYDKQNGTSNLKDIPLNNDKKVFLEIQSKGGVIITNHQ